jgi:hypothetical protein
METDPIFHSYAAHPVMIVRQTWQPRMQLCDHGIEVVEDPVRELLFSQFIPYMLLRIELSACGGRGDSQIFSGMARSLARCAAHPTGVPPRWCGRQLNYTCIEGVILWTPPPVNGAGRRGGLALATDTRDGP